MTALNAKLMRQSIDGALTASCEQTLALLAGPGRLALEVGGPTSDLGRALCERGCRVVAIRGEATATMDGDANCYDRVVIADLDRYDLAGALSNERFDLIVIRDPLAHSADPLRLFLAVKDYLRPDGKLIAGVPCGDPLPPGGASEQLVACAARDATEQCLDEAGFAVEQVETWAGSQLTQLPASKGTVERPEPGAHNAWLLLVARDRLPAEISAAQHRLRNLVQQAQADRREAVEARRVLTDLNGQVTALTARLASLVRRERELREMLLDAHDQLLRRDEEIQVTVAATLQQQSPNGAAKGRPLPGQHLAYQQLIHRVRETVQTALPPGATVLVISRGDEELTKLVGRTGWHFPQGADGVYAGYHPSDSAAAIAHLKEVRARGGQYILVPSTAFWWFDHYQEFRQYLDVHYRIVVRQDETCVVYALHEAADRPRMDQQPAC